MSGIRLLHTQADKAAFAGAIAGKPRWASMPPVFSAYCTTAL